MFLKIRNCRRQVFYWFVKYLRNPSRSLILIHVSRVPAVSYCHQRERFTFTRVLTRKILSLLVNILQIRALLSETLRTQILPIRGLQRPSLTFRLYSEAQLIVYFLVRYLGINLIKKNYITGQLLGAEEFKRAEELSGDASSC